MAVKSKEILLHDVMLLLGKQHASLSWETEPCWAGGAFYCVWCLNLTQMFWKEEEKKKAQVLLGVRYPGFVQCLFGADEIKRDKDE